MRVAVGVHLKMRVVYRWKLLELGLSIYLSQRHISQSEAQINTTNSLCSLSSELSREQMQHILGSSAALYAAQPSEYVIQAE